MSPIDPRRFRRGLAAAVLALAAAAPGASAQTREDKALGRPASASSFQQTSVLPPSQTCIPCLPRKANDGNSGTRWGSNFSDGQSWQVDLGAARLVDTVRLNWEESYASVYRIETSLDGGTFTQAALVNIGSSGIESTAFAARAARYVRVTGIQRANADKGISFWDAQVFGPADPPTSPAAAPSAPTAGTTGTVAGGATGGRTPAGGPTPAASSPGAAIRLPDAGPPSAGARSGPLVLLTPFPVVRIRGTVTRRGARINLLTVRAPRGARIEARCSGAGCPKPLIVRTRRMTRLRRLERTYRSGTVIEVLVTRAGRIGKYTRFRLRKGKAPVRTDGCASFGARGRSSCSR